MSTPRRCFSTGQKTTIHFVDKLPMSDLCDEYGIKPNQIYTWQKILFDHAESAFHQAGQEALHPGGTNCPAADQADPKERGHL